MKVDFDQIKRTTDLVRVIESYGITLKKSGRDYVGLCPFHDDHHPSLRVTPAKGLFRCPSCQATGNVIQFVAKKEGIGERQAALKLLTATPGVKPASALPPKTPPAKAAPAMKAGEQEALLQRVVTFYAKTLHKDRAGFEYLKGRNLVDAAMLDVFQVGYCNGTLPNAVAKSGEVVECLKTLGILKAGNREHFHGFATVPIFDEAGTVVGIYGRNVQPCEPDQRHRYLPGPHRGVFNGIAAKTSQTLFLTESIFDAMALWQAGFKNVIALYGTGGWTADHEKLLREHGTTEVYLCLNNDEPGRTATEQLKGKILPALVKQIHVVQWPEGVKDAADFFLSRPPADFEALVKTANPGTPAPQSEVTAKAGDEKIEMTPDGFVASYASRRYEVRAVEHPNPARLRATVKAFSAEGAMGSATGARFHIDTVDFYLSRSRRTFISEAARLFRDTADVIEGDVNRLITQLETYAKEREGKGAQSQVTLVSDTDKVEALKLGRHPDLAGEILRDLERFGLVGELTNKTIGYVAMTSRKMDDPLSLLILSGSGAGKSLLQDTLLKLCPDEDLVKLTSLTGEALFYMGQDALKHKVLALEEHAGAQEADYAIRNLISAKKLVKEATIKDPMTGRLTTMRNVVDGPCAVFKTTTQPEMDAETKSRFIITSIDESPEQTKAILEAQRHNHTLDGIRRKKQREQVVQRHHAFQRLLKPVAVVNPFEPLLTYAENRLLVRRDNPKYLHLILAVTFLYQLQRPVKHDADAGDYIETTLDDIAIANELATDLFGQSLGELSRPSRELLKLIRRMTEEMERKPGVAAEQKVGAGTACFSRRQIREFTGWSDYQIKIHVKQLEDLEYLLPLSGRRGQCFSYRLAWDGEGLDGERFVLGLTSVEELRQKAKVVGLKNEVVGSKSEVVGPKTKLEGSSRVQVGLAGNRANPCKQRLETASEPKLEGFAGKPVPALPQNGVPNGPPILVTTGGAP
jgi:DNA primase catalytic core